MRKDIALTVHSDVTTRSITRARNVIMDHLNKLLTLIHVMVVNMDLTTESARKIGILSYNAKPTWSLRKMQIGLIHFKEEVDKIQQNDLSTSHMRLKHQGKYIKELYAQFVEIKSNPSNYLRQNYPPFPFIDRENNPPQHLDDIRSA